MARFLADQLDRVQFIRVYNGSRDFQSYSDPLAFGFSIATILDELTIPPMHFLHGRFESRERFSGAEPITFPKPIGKLTMRHSIHSEVATLPISFKSKGIQEAFFKINYDPKLIEVTELLAGIGLLEQRSVTVGGQIVSPRAFLEHLLKLRPLSNKTPKDIETIRVVAKGSKDGRERTISMDATTRYQIGPSFSAVARDTGFPISVAAQMISAGEISAMGVHAAGDRDSSARIFGAASRTGHSYFWLGLAIDGASSVPTFMQIASSSSTPRAKRWQSMPRQSRFLAACSISHATILCSSKLSPADIKPTTYYRGSFSLVQCGKERQKTNEGQKPSQRGPAKSHRVPFDFEFFKSQHQ